MSPAANPNPEARAGGRRDYAPILARAPRGLSRDRAMQWAVDSLWDAYRDDRLSWIGFYTKTPGADEMILLARRDKPACSPLGLNGMCGRCWKERRALVLDDVRAVPASEYVACDPRDLSEVVVPLFETDGTCWGVLDADSHEARAFNEHDAVELTSLVERLGLSAPGRAQPGVLHL